MPAHGAGLLSAGSLGQLVALGMSGEVSAEGEGVNMPEGNAQLEPGLSSWQEGR